MSSLEACVIVLINVLTAQNGEWSVTAIAYLSIVGGSTLVMESAIALYQLWLFPKATRMYSANVLQVKVYKVYRLACYIIRGGGCEKEEVYDFERLFTAQDIETKC